MSDGIGPADQFETIPVEGELPPDVIKTVPQVLRTEGYQLPLARYRLTLYLMVMILTILTGLAVLVALDEIAVREFKDLAGLVLTPLFTLLGSAITFYFSHEGLGRS